MHYKQIRRCETALVCEEGFSTEEVFASTAPATQFNAAYLSRIGISGLGVQQLLLRLHLRLHQKHRRLTEEAAVAELAVTTAGAGAGDSSGAGATTGTVDA